MPIRAALWESTGNSGSLLSFPRTDNLVAGCGAVPVKDGNVRIETSLAGGDRMFVMATVASCGAVDQCIFRPCCAPTGRPCFVCPHPTTHGIFLRVILYTICDMFSRSHGIQHPTPGTPLPAAQSSLHGLKPAGAAHDPVVSLIPYTLHPADFNAAIKGCTTSSPADARVGCQSKEHRDYSTPA